MSIISDSQVSIASLRNFFKYLFCIRWAGIIIVIVFLGSSKFKCVAPDLAMNIWAFWSVQPWWADVFLMVGLVVAEEIT